MKNFLEENKNIKKLKPIFIILFGLLGFFIIFSLIYLGCIYTGNNMVKKQETEIPVESFKYDVFVDQWNHIVNNLKLGSKAYLPKSDPKKIIDKLNSHIESFHTQFSENTEDEFIRFRKKNNYSLVSFYYNFLIKFRIKEKMTFTTKMSSIKIKERLCEITETEYIEEKTLKIIFSMASICNFFNFYKEDSYNNGLSRRIKEYNDSNIELKQYPALYSYLKCH